MLTRSFGSLAAWLLSATVILAQERPVSYWMLPLDAVTQPAAKIASPPIIPVDAWAMSGPDPDASYWASSEYLLWWVKNASVRVPLLTGNNNPAAIGALNEKGTVVLFGAGSNQNNNFGTFSGLRMTIGGWLADNHLVGWEGSGFLLERRGIFFDAASGGGASPIVSIPVNATQPFLGQPAGETAVSAGNTPTAASVRLTSRLWSAEANALLDLWSGDGLSWTAMVGFRYIDLNENLTLNYVTTDVAANGIAALTDGFGARNQFYAAQIGTRIGLSRGRWDLESTIKVAFGPSHQVQNIAGGITVTNGAFGNPNGTTPGGIFAEPTNIGQANRNVFTVAPEVQLKLGYWLTPNIRPFLGYSFLQINNVIRAGNQIDRNINPTQNAFLVPPGALVGEPAPLPTFRSSEFTAHGVSLGVEIRY